MSNILCWLVSHTPKVASLFPSELQSALGILFSVLSTYSRHFMWQRPPLEAVPRGLPAARPQRGATPRLGRAICPASCGCGRVQGWSDLAPAPSLAPRTGSLYYLWIPTCFVNPHSDHLMVAVEIPKRAAWGRQVESHSSVRLKGEEHDLKKGKSASFPSPTRPRALVAAVTMHTYRIHREDERRQLDMLALVAPLPGLFATPMARHKSKKSPERERERERKRDL